MRFLERTLIGAIAGLAMVVSADAATTRSYTGNYAVTVSRSQHSNRTYCLTLTTLGNIGDGVFEDVYGGEDFDSGALVFMKGGC
jgi:hypothetical protein